MADYYENESLEYHRNTFYIDPSSFLLPLKERLSPGAQVLDVGCASGRDILWLKTNGFEATGFERCRGLSALARSNTGCRVVEADFYSFDFSTLEFDAVMLVGALVHVPHQELPIILEKICRCLRSGGLVLITLKEGVGQKADETGRMFYLWNDAHLARIFEHLHLLTVAFDRQVSKIKDSDTWLTYVLRRGPLIPDPATR